jgi:saccharopine dehydrogenase-like NADP-dependent oxidoreductase
MSRIVVRGGAGIIGKAIVQDLAEDVKEVIIADLYLPQTEEAAEEIGRGCVARRVDVTKPEQLSSVLADADACVNGAQYYFNLEVMAGYL